VFGKKGYLETRVEDILNESGVSRGTFYYYFRNKRDLFKQLIESVVQEMLEEATRPTGVDDRYAKIAVRNRGFLEVWAANADVLRSLFQLSVIDDEFAQLHRELRLKFISRIEERLARDVANGTCRALDPKIAARALGAMVDWFAFLWLAAREFQFPHRDLDAVSEELSDLWYHAVYGRSDRSERAAP